MALQYKIKEIKNMQDTDGNVIYSITLLTGRNTTLREMGELINDKSSITVGDVEGVVKQLIDVIVQQLRMGNTVTIDGLGTFWLSAELKNKIKDPDQITGKDIRIKRICFKPCPEFKEKFKDISITRFTSDKFVTRR
ncbi:MAG: HU family DNA-binding protein [Tannerellaceae bacterium]|nr:HU family DNA-binding protein [Tannerellaceae bacterium]